MSINPLKALVLCCLLACVSCTDPIVPLYEFQSGFMVVDGRITDQPGYSFVTIKRNVEQFNEYRLVPEDVARVYSVDDRGETVIWQATDTVGYFLPPSDFSAMPDHRYSLNIETNAGEVISSPLQELPPRVGFTNLRYRFDQEAYYSETRERFVPAFTFLVDVEDPAEQENYYQYRFRTWETVDVCFTCRGSRYRNGRCITEDDTRNVDHWDYLCDVPCWAANIGAGRNIFRDEFSDGNRIPGVQAGRLDFDRRGGLLYEVEQANISSRAYEFAEILNNLTNNGGGLNAPLPAPLVGNLTDESPLETDVLGFVSVESLTLERRYINRDTVSGQPLPMAYDVVLEPVIPSPPNAPCIGGNRTPVLPDGWPE